MSRTTADQRHRPADARLDARAGGEAHHQVRAACTTPSTATPASCAAIRTAPLHRGQCEAAQETVSMSFPSAFPAIVVALAAALDHRRRRA